MVDKYLYFEQLVWNILSTGRHTMCLVVSTKAYCDGVSINGSTFDSPDTRDKN